MDQAAGDPEADDMLAEYDFTDAEVGKYAERYAKPRRGDDRPRARDADVDPGEDSSG